MLLLANSDLQWLTTGPVPRLTFSFGPPLSTCIPQVSSWFIVCILAQLRMFTTGKDNGYVAIFFVIVDVTVEEIDWDHKLRVTHCFPATIMGPASTSVWMLKIEKNPVHILVLFGVRSLYHWRGSSSLPFHRMSPLRLFIFEQTVVDGSSLPGETRSCLSLKQP